MYLSPRRAPSLAGEQWQGNILTNRISSIKFNLLEETGCNLEAKKEEPSLSKENGWSLAEECL